MQKFLYVIIGSPMSPVILRLVLLETLPETRKVKIFFSFARISNLGVTNTFFKYNVYKTWRDFTLRNRRHQIDHFLVD